MLVLYFIYKIMLSYEVSAICSLKIPRHNKNIRATFMNRVLVSILLTLNRCQPIILAFRVKKAIFKVVVKTLEQCLNFFKVTNNDDQVPVTIWVSLLLTLKSDSHLSKNRGICFIESLLKMMKNAFYFILKALIVLKIFKFLSRLFCHIGKMG